MGIAERKAKEKEELKKLILQAAKKLFAEKGIEQTTIRNIANAIEYSVGTVYVYFKDKKEILHELHTQGFKQLGGDMRVLFNVSDPMERLKALGRVYLQFSIENQDMYDLMFHMKEPIECLESQEWSEGCATFDVLRTTVNECMENGHFKGHQLEPLTFAIWSTVHGMASLHIAQRVERVNLKEPETILYRAYDEFVLMMDKS
ncbi:TetR/AcrR family transcriptional regulator [Fulvivirga ulvae]|uniref:TetR/AcrR family transcriptional regulator n=1 Tax=Fulvivirga ulvae TaxID=2904245 RepID=UPI001F277188|nr:TetR/AcrR family transcriptional regulator [Fulvivirga ulvae]UII31168.1 TetR/AcrR family transcriptional regulator [Fulvivirga ulvae]